MDTGNPMVGEYCPHGNSRGGICEACLGESRDSQPAWKLVEQLRSESRYQRSLEGSPECTIEREGKKYEVKMLRPEDEATIQEVQRMLEETFGEDETDPIEYLRAGIQGKTPDGEDDETRYRIFTARDEAGKLQSVYAGGLLEMRSPDGKSTGDAMFMGAYGITRPESRQGGLVRELYASSMMMAALDAQAAGKKFSTIAGECTYTSEKAWNAVGRRRAYVQTGENQYSELQYIQPALEFNKKTGLPKKGQSEVAEHIMVQFLDSQSSKERISAAVDAMYRWCNLWSADSFASKKAHAAHTEYIAGIKRRFDEFMSSNGDLKFLTAAEREEAIKQGFEIIGYNAADHGDTGPEDA